MFIPFGAALRESLSEGYGLQKLRADVLAGFIVALIALPLSMALSIAVGLPPQHGIYTAIIAGIITPLLGGSRMQVSGPTAAFVVIVAPIVAEYGLHGLILIQLIAGLILVLLAWGKLGRFINFVPYPVTTGFTAGIAVVLATMSLNDLLGLGANISQGAFVSKLFVLAEHLPNMQWQEALVGIISLTVMFKGKWISTRIPSTILGVIAGIIISIVLRQVWGIETATIGSRFSYETASGLMHGIPPYPPILHWFSGDSGLFALPTWNELNKLFIPAVVIAALAALESLLSATVADGMSHSRHEPNAELGAIGVANMLSGLAAGIPATGAIARTTTNIKSAAQTPLASALHGVFILLFVLLLAPWISYLPMASLAALLVITAYNMSHYKQFFRIMRIATRQDVMVLLICFGLTVFIDMVAGVTVGIMLAALLFIQRIATLTQSNSEEASSMGSHVPSGVLLYHINGPLFFGSVERALNRTVFLRKHIHTVILDMEHVPLIDMTGLIAIKTLLESSALKNHTLVVCANGDTRIKLEQKLHDIQDRRVTFTTTVSEALSMLTAA